MEEKITELIFFSFYFINHFHIFTEFVWEKENKKTAKMDAIKKKMQAMKMEKDAAMDKADTCEGQAKDANARADKVNQYIHLNIKHFIWI